MKKAVFFFTVCHLLVSCIFFAFVANAQADTGVQFEHGLTWTQIKEKARIENKSIFLDAYTTWCAPCKMMDKRVFPQQKVGAFFNSNFINVKVQIDTTENDNEATKSWYSDAAVISKTYNIESFPTFLFFNPAGELVHRINGGFTSGEAFIAKAKAALNPYAKQKRMYKTGKRDTAFLLQLIKEAQLMNDSKFLPVIINEYLATQKNLLNADNIRLLAVSTANISDPGFAVLRNNGEEADAVLGKGESARIVKAIIFDEIVFPYLRTNGDKIDYGGGMIGYVGKVNENVNWAVIEEKLNKEFPDLAQEIIMNAKPQYYQWLGDWKAYTNFIISNKNRIAKSNLNSYAANVFLFSDDNESLETAIEWMKDMITHGDESNAWYLYTYANLMYKTGKKENAIRNMEKAILLLSEEESSDFIKNLTAMRNNEKTW